MFKTKLLPVLLFATWACLGAFSQVRPQTMVITKVGTTSPAAAEAGAPGLYADEINDIAGDDDEDTPFAGVNRTIVNGPGLAPTAPSGKKAKSNPSQLLAFEGLNFHNQRFANGGNQFSVEPPDQALCAGNGFVLEAVNDVLRVFDSGGNAVSGVVDLNTFYGYIAAINRTTNARGPDITDPVCQFDPDTGRFFVVVLTLDHVGTTATRSGKNHLDIAVSDTGNPLGTWTVYRLPVHNNGQDGTPDHGCNLGFCLGDYPHIGMDANGLYLTTNEFSFFGPGFYGAQIYAMSKRALANGAASTPVFLFNTLDAGLLFEGAPGFTVWPAITPGAAYEYGAGGTEYLLSSIAIFSGTGTDNRLRVWAISNTSSLDTASPNLVLTHNIVSTTAYSVPGRARQKTGGDWPLGQCLLDTSIPVTSTLNGCWRFFLASPPPATGPNAVSYPQNIDGNDSRMQQVVFANGKLWSSLGTGVSINSRNLVGVAYFVLKPDVSTGSVTAKVAQNGLIGLANNNLTYPAVGVTPSGRGVIAFTVLGDDYFPSAGYAPLDALVGAGDIQISAAGAGPQDGFTAYRILSGTSRKRWGDYGATAVDGNIIWIASEYINQTCNLDTFVSSNFTCGGTRASFGNWSTHVAKIQP